MVLWVSKHLGYITVFGFGRGDLDRQKSLITACCAYRNDCAWLLWMRKVEDLAVDFRSN